VTDEIRLTVYGVAQPQGSKTGFVNKKTNRVVIVEGRRGPARTNFAEWRRAVADGGRAWRQGHPDAPLLDEPLGLAITFYMPKPKSAPKWKRWASTRPDVDKLARSVCDSLTGVLFVDDARIVDLHVTKVYGDPPRVEIVLTPLGASERAGVPS
jgi:crossover junction endodeoxyribonuclease RusA